MPALATILPLLSALAYAFAAMMLKRATARGVGPWRISFITNWVTALAFLPWWFTGGGPVTWPGVGHALICGSTFFIGQIFTFLAITRGDVSLATPVLGTKVIFVAFFAIFLAGEKLTPGLWLAALVTAIATALLGGGGRHGDQPIGKSLIYGFTAAAAFALTDSLMQRWIQGVGFGHFAPVMFGTIALLSFGLVPLFSAPLRALPTLTWRWAIGGSAMLALQAMGISYAIGIYREVTKANILYNTRGMWSVVLVWLIGHWFDNAERDHGARVMIRRMIGAPILLSAVFHSVRG
jgi:drug/metabolite transporter (DMT)-like permease